MGNSALGFIDLTLIGVYFAVVLVFGLIKRKSDASGETQYLLSGRKLTLPFFVATLVSTWYGAILGVGEYGYLYGVSIWLIFGVPYYVFAILYAFFLAGKVRSNPAATIPEAVGNAFGKTAGRVSAALVFLLVNPAPYILMLALLFGHIAGVDGYVLLISSGIALFSAVYVSGGGFGAVVRTDAIQVVLMFLGFGLIVITAMGHLSPVELWQRLPETHRDLTGGQSVQYLLVWFFIAMLTFADPGFHQRVAAAKSGASARKGILISVGFWFLFDSLSISAALYSSTLAGELENTSLAFPALADTLLAPGARGLFYLALLATIMSTLDSFLFLSGQTLGKDILKAIFPAQSTIKLVQWSVFASVVVSLVMILILPGIISMWYVAGSIVVPGLLVPVLAAYFPAMKLSRHGAVIIGIAASCVSFVWAVAGGVTNGGNGDFSFWGIEPFYPGIAVSLFVWVIARTGDIVKE